jgi:hypothetical protein
MGCCEFVEILYSPGCRKEVSSETHIHDMILRCLAPTGGEVHKSTLIRAKVP